MKISPRKIIKKILKICQAYLKLTKKKNQSYRVKNFLVRLNPSPINPFKIDRKYFKDCHWEAYVLDYLNRRHHDIKALSALIHTYRVVPGLYLEIGFPPTSSGVYNFGIMWFFYVYRTAQLIHVLPSCS